MSWRRQRFGAAEVARPLRQHYPANRVPLGLRLAWRAMRERARGVRRTSMYHAAALMMRELWLVHDPAAERYVLHVT